MPHKWVENPDEVPYLWKCSLCGASIYTTEGRPRKDRKVIVGLQKLTCEEVQTWRVHGP